MYEAEYTRPVKVRLMAQVGEEVVPATPSDIAEFGLAPCDQAAKRWIGMVAGWLGPEALDNPAINVLRYTIEVAGEDGHLDDQTGADFKRVLFGILGFRWPNSR